MILRCRPKDRALWETILCGPAQDPRKLLAGARGYLNARVERTGDTLELECRDGTDLVLHAWLEPGDFINEEGSLQAGDGVVSRRALDRAQSITRPGAVGKLLIPISVREISEAVHRLGRISSAGRGAAQTFSEAMEALKSEALKKRKKGKKGKGRKGKKGKKSKKGKSDHSDDALGYATPGILKDLEESGYGVEPPPVG